VAHGLGQGGVTDLQGQDGSSLTAWALAWREGSASGLLAGLEIRAGVESCFPWQATGHTSAAGLNLCELRWDVLLIPTDFCLEFVGVNEGDVELPPRFPAV
jgi:hypothetical protein